MHKNTKQVVYLLFITSYRKLVLICSTDIFFLFILLLLKLWIWNHLKYNIDLITYLLISNAWYKSEPSLEGALVCMYSPSNFGVRKREQKEKRKIYYYFWRVSPRIWKTYDDSANDCCLTICYKRNLSKFVFSPFVYRFHNR